MCCLGSFFYLFQYFRTAKSLQEFLIPYEIILQFPGLMVYAYLRLRKHNFWNQFFQQDPYCCLLFS
jgi:hypothetical protein